MSKRVFLVVSYKNRRTQFLYTLKRLHTYNSIDHEEHALHDLNVIIIDDGSDIDNRLEDIVDNYNFCVKIFYIDPVNKTWINPCLTYNIGFFKIDDAHDDDIVIIQNPECAHLGNVLQYTIDNLTHKDYFVFNCAALNENQTAELITTDNFGKSNRSFVGDPSMYDASAGVDWYVHPKFRPKYYHFCSCITYGNLKKLNGFDLRFAAGDAFDDDEFTMRVKKLGLKRQFISDPYVSHLWHPIYKPSSMSNLYRNRDLFASLENNLSENYMVNRGIPGADPQELISPGMEEYCKGNFGITGNFELSETAKTRIKRQKHVTYLFSPDWPLKKIPKIAHFYWGSDKMSFLRYLTIYSFIKFNPDWEVRLYIPKTVSSNVFWRTSGDDDHHRCDQLDYTSDEDYFTSLPSTIKIIKTDFSSSFIGSDAPEAHKSDLLGWQILSTSGGFWCDMDILFFKGLHEIIFKSFDYDTLVCYDHRHTYLGQPSAPIGFFFSCPNNILFKKILNKAKLIYNKNRYQSIGTYAIATTFKSVNHCMCKCPELTIGNLDYNLVYRYDYLHLDDLFLYDNFKALLSSDDSIGCHWYGGDPQSLEYNNKINIDNYKTLPDSTITQIIKYINPKNE